MRTLLIDNYDSFTFNLYQLLAQVNGEPPVVVRNDAGTWLEVSKLNFDNVVVSPGPGRPENARDFGISADAIRYGEVPLLGVCLGHQGLASVLGGTVSFMEEPRHGRSSLVFHDRSELFDEIPNPFNAIRYHSLEVTGLPEGLECIARTADGTSMALRHAKRPLWGVQFHPESIGSEFGLRLLQNFRQLSLSFSSGFSRRRRNPGASVRKDLEALPEPSTSEAAAGGNAPPIHGRPLRIFHRRIPTLADAEQVFLAHFADSCPSFWLDRALEQDFSRFSFMGDASGPHAEFLTYDLADRKVLVHRQGSTTEHDESIFSYLDRELRLRRAHDEALPFDFNLGYAGYFGYELKAECGGEDVHRSPTPDAAFVFADRIIAFDHQENATWLVCLDSAAGEDRARRWLDRMSKSLLDLPRVRPWKRSSSQTPAKQQMRHDADGYLNLILRCQEEIRRGESYEICLTNMVRADVSIDPLNTYRALRSANPAPYAAFLNFPGAAVLSSSPERFIIVDAQGNVESKPIKGTRRRGSTPEEDQRLREELRTSEKDRAENLMIVDLLRNDLGRVCEIGSVHVPEIFEVESYATVHQLVSTIRGRLRRGISGVQCVQAAFPGGSMTGAPKKRTMEIIDRFEAGPRGIYSGAIGFLGLNGSVDLGMVIRAIVATPHEVTFGVGGAVTSLSDPCQELDEIRLKARALVSAIGETALEPDPAPTDGHSMKLTAAASTLSG